MTKESATQNTFLQLLFRLLFMVVPTVAIAYLTLRYVNATYTALETNIAYQALFFAGGITISYILHFYRIRAILTFALLAIAYWIVKMILLKTPGETDLFYTMVMFKSYSFLFITGWIFGFLLAAPLLLFGMQLSRTWFGYIPISVVFFLASIFTASDLRGDVLDNHVNDWSVYFYAIIPVVLYALYMLFMGPALAESINMDWKKSGKTVIRAALLAGLVILAFILVHRDFNLKLIAVQKQVNEINKPGPGHEGENGDKEGYNEKKGLLERGHEPGKGKGTQYDPNGDPGGKKPGDDGEDGYKLKDTMKMSDKMSQADYLMFCSKLNNYFPDGTPKPLYFVYHYLTKYDPEKESFIRDTAMPYFDEMKTDPSSLAMYRSKTDSSVIRNSLGRKLKKVVEAQVYVSSNTWKHALLAPASAFYVQTIPVDSSYKKLFRSAYKVKSYVSELNNAYFVYNPSANPQLGEMQQERFEELQSVKDYTNTDSAFYVYYTQMPKGPLYDSIDALAKKITRDAVTPIDKVIAIRDFFLQKDKEGSRIFRYSLNAGAPSDPNIPNASMLRNFIFKTHTGYCTYYAGASLFLLRSMGIPSRFTTGFATIDRSDKNKGWYWFYASQAHAWTQVYFPGYGWLDFDMTIGNEDQKEAPRPDGTPPLPPPEPWLVVMGKAETKPDLKKKQLEVSFNKIIFFNEDYPLNKTYTRTIDASVCRVIYDKTDTTLSCIQPGDSLVIVSYDDASKKVPQPKEGMSIEEQLEAFPTPIVADEIHIKPHEVKQKAEDQKKPGKQTAKDEMSWGQIFLRVLLAAGILVVLIFFVPLFFLWWLILRAGAANEPKKKADRVYRLALYHFHMAGVERAHETPLQYAMEKADPAFHAGFSNFMGVYLRLKYASGQLLPGDSETIHAFGKAIRPAVRKKTGFFRMAWNYLNIFRANRYFRRPEDHTNEEQKTTI